MHECNPSLFIENIFKSFKSSKLYPGKIKILEINFEKLSNLQKDSGPNNFSCTQIISLFIYFQIIFLLTKP